MNPDFWGIFHDGHIWKFEGKVPGEVTVHVNVLYLRQMFPGSGDGFRVVLSGCEFIEYREYDEAPTRDLLKIQEREPEILYVDSTEPVILDCVMGALELRYASATTFLDSGEPVSYDELAAGCKAYWDAWQQGHSS